MAKQARVSSGQLKRALREDFQRLVREVSAAVNEAPDGSVIAGSEFQVRDLLARFRETVYQKAIQLRTEAAEAAFPPSGGSGRSSGAEQGAPVGDAPDGERADPDRASGLVAPGGGDGASGGRVAGH
jgi:hypothetical protein